MTEAPVKVQTSVIRGLEKLVNTNEFKLMFDKEWADMHSTRNKNNDSALLPAGGAPGQQAADG